MQSFNVKVNIASHIKILVESGIDNTSSNISTIPITILYTSKINLKTNHNTGIHYNIGTNFYTSIAIAKYRRSQTNKYHACDVDEKYCKGSVCL